MSEQQLLMQLENERKLAQKRGKTLSLQDIERIYAPFYTPPTPPSEHVQKLAPKLELVTPSQLQTSPQPSKTVDCI